MGSIYVQQKLKPLGPVLISQGKILPAGQSIAGFACINAFYSFKVPSMKLLVSLHLRRLFD